LIQKWWLEKADPVKPKVENLQALKADTTAAERSRMARLRSLNILDTQTEPLFDALTKAAALMTGMPIALITLVDENRQWFKSNVGLSDVQETPRDVAFCSYTIQGGEIMEIPDATIDARFAHNPLVTGAPGIRFYAGVPITLRDGLRMGALAVIDRRANMLSNDQRHALRELAHAAAEALDQRAILLEKNAALVREADVAREQAGRAVEFQKKLKASEAFLDRTGRAAGVGGWEVNLVNDEVIWSDETCRIHEVPPGYHPTMAEAIEFYAPEAREVIEAAVKKSIEDGRSWDLELPLITAKGRNIWVRAVGNSELEDGKPCRLVGAFQDVTLRKRAIAALENSDRRFRKLFEYSLGLICTHDADGVLLSVNPAAAHSLDYSMADLLGRSLADFMRPERRAGFQSYLDRIFTDGADSGVLELIAGDGSLRVWEYHNVLDDESDEPYVLGHAQDVTERYQHQRKLEEWSLRDPLTGCFNRRFITDLEASLGELDLWGCIAFDLDRFKRVNDQFGHQRGDEVLVAMARFLSNHLRPEDAVVRMGGDEFLVLLKHADASLTETVVTRINEDRSAAPISFTMGSAINHRGEPLEHMLAEADRRLYETRAIRATSTIDNAQLIR
jgi:diguanylate cyclase (GGDEF)-like protein/PAS domain S-box-containing protein